MRNSSLSFLLLLGFFLKAQSPSEQMRLLEKEVQEIDFQKEKLLEKIEHTKLLNIHNNLIINGLPAIQKNEEIIHHSTMSLVYSEAHEQAKWVAHIISPDILNGQVSRSNDFREDPLVKTGTAIEEDYFLRIVDENGETQFDGFGYDRGHLAPSADFRWTKKGLSESYFYSNMAPQVADFNRKSWADLENLLRAYVYSQQMPLYVVTGGLLTNDLAKIERGIHKISIPNYFWKVAIDLKNQKGIAFLMPNQKADYPIEHYAVSIDKIEQLTGIDFYVGLADKLENKLERQKEVKDWILAVALGDVEPLKFVTLPTKHYNTIVGKKQMGTGSKIHICGTVVRSRTSRKGNVILNLDKAYPNEIFNVFINQKNLINFASNPVNNYVNQVICAYGEVSNQYGVPVVYASDDNQIKFYSQRVSHFLKLDE